MLGVQRAYSVNPFAAAPGRRRAGPLVAAAFILGVAPTVGAGVVAQSPAAHIRLDATFSPPVLGAGSAQFSFLMWLQRSHSDAQPLQLLDIPGAFDVLVDGTNESIRTRLSGTPETLELVLPLRDGSVGVGDFLLLLAVWGPCPAPPDACPADLDGDGSVGVTDFLVLLSEWGP